MDPLDSLLEQAVAAPRGNRIDYRDRIAAHGVSAVERVAPWTQDADLGGFAVRVLGRAASVARPEAVAALVAAAQTGATPQVRADAEDELIRLGAAEALASDADFKIEETGEDPRGRAFVRFRTRAQASGNFTLRQSVMDILGLTTDPWVDMDVSARDASFRVVMKLGSGNEVYPRQNDRATRGLERIRSYELIEVTVRAASPRAPS